MSMYTDLVLSQQTYFSTGHTRPVKERKKQLMALRQAISDNEEAILEALHGDLHKSHSEAFMTEIGYLYKEIDFTLKHLKKWCEPKSLDSRPLLPGGKGTIYPQPYGSVLILAPWNYPFQLAIAPLIGAIAAGNCAVVKPSEMTPRTSHLLHWLLTRTFPESYVAVVQGDVHTAEALLEAPFDYLFFTGSPAIGKKVMAAAAKQLIPHTLELGGKSPAIVHKDADMKKTADRIAWGKVLNAGQTCVAPDYIMVHEDVYTSLLDALKQSFQKQMKHIDKEGFEYPKLVHDKHFDRMVSFLDEGTIAFGGEHDRSRRFFAPTILTNLPSNARIMEEEIFGPILPVLQYRSFTQVKAQVNKHPNPLAAYLFTETASLQKEFIHDISFGGGCINDTILHLTSPELPFGGIGSSGTGQYHGKYSFDTFSHYKSIVKQSTRFEVPGRYKRGPRMLKMIKKLF
ncbi:aldehyde dehydrogenase [Bacillaceae bacterium SIJ1]|uniref:aldehyde dehydrogenase n=1 Tax=Litoribacterium kuwaitense TaxID=1398745 RepID=UPI0013E9A6CE|nr:aldehyde dehydrogenase [Litoribacterium kuwaitense]NGP44815.1 aldehyde dehydrogenase [Litoribacterium kuwaitense]